VILTATANADIKAKMEELAVLDGWLRTHCPYFRGTIVLDQMQNHWDLVAWTERTLKKMGEKEGS
jgi:hypothetical protein